MCKKQNLKSESIDPKSEVSIWTGAFVPIKGAEKLASQPEFRATRPVDQAPGKVTNSKCYHDRVLPGRYPMEYIYPVLVILMVLGSPRKRVP